MSQRLVLIASILGIIAVPFVYSLSGTCAEPPVGIRVPDPDPLVGKEAPSTGATYLELVKQKVALLTAEELVHETEILRKELAELQANRKLREAEQNLEQVIEQFQGSSAAQRARLMLDAGRQQIVPPRNRPRTEIFFEESVVPQQRSFDSAPPPDDNDPSRRPIRPVPDATNKRR